MAKSADLPAIPVPVMLASGDFLQFSTEIFVLSSTAYDPCKGTKKQHRRQQFPL